MMGENARVVASLAVPPVIPVLEGETNNVQQTSKSERLFELQLGQPEDTRKHKIPRDVDHECKNQEASHSKRNRLEQAGALHDGNRVSS